MEVVHAVSLRGHLLYREDLRQVRYGGGIGIHILTHSAAAEAAFAVAALRVRPRRSGTGFIHHERAVAEF